jgi:hypothetical protein
MRRSQRNHQRHEEQQGPRQVAGTGPDVGERAPFRPDPEISKEAQQEKDDRQRIQVIACVMVEEPGSGRQLLPAVRIPSNNDEG